VKFLPIFESIKPEDLERAVESPELATDKREVGRYEYHPAVYEFMQACYENGFIQRTFNWPAWGKAATLYLNDAAFIDRARLTTCIKLIMASVRYQRFCDGHLGEVIKSGHITAIPFVHLNNWRMRVCLANCYEGRYYRQIAPRKGDACPFLNGLGDSETIGAAKRTATESAHTA
jgi:Family of unknown function (DUF6508)